MMFTSCIHLLHIHLFLEWDGDQSNRRNMIVPLYEEGRNATLT